MLNQKDVAAVAEAVKKKLLSDNPGLVTQVFCNERTKGIEFKINTVRRLLYAVIVILMAGIGQEAGALVFLKALFGG